MLAAVLREHPDELRADFQEVYGLNVDGMGRDYSTLHAAALLAQLPEGSRVLRCYSEDAAWTSERSLLAAIVNDLNWLVWSKSKDGQRNRNRPRPIGPGTGGGRERRIVGMAMTADELMDALARAHGEVAPHG